jgi:hypothetical protein
MANTAGRQRRKWGWGRHTETTQEGRGSARVTSQAGAKSRSDRGRAQRSRGSGVAMCQVCSGAGRTSGGRQPHGQGGQPDKGREAPAAAGCSRATKRGGCTQVEGRWRRGGAYLPVADKNRGRRGVGVRRRGHLLHQLLLLRGIARSRHCVQRGTTLIDGVVLLHDAALVLLLLLRPMGMVRAHAHAHPAAFAPHDAR